MTDSNLVLRKLAILREHLQRVHRRRSAGVDDFERDVDAQDALALSLLVAIQEALDIAMHIAADEGWGTPVTYAESFEVLARHDVVDAELARDLGRAVAVRNRIAHGYASLDVRRLWAELPAGLAALDRYVAAVATFAGVSDGAGA